MLPLQDRLGLKYCLILVFSSLGGVGMQKYFDFFLILQKLDSNMENISPEEYYKAYANDKTMKKETSSCSIKELFRFADRKDVFLMIIGTIFSLANGVSLIFYALPFGQLVQAFVPGKDPQEIVDDALESVKLFLINSAIVFVNSWFMSAAWTITSERQMIRARQAYFGSLMDQEIAWHDRNRPAQVCSKMYIEIAKVHQGLVTNVTSVLTKISMGLSGIIIAMIEGWQMALVMVAFLPLMMVAGFVSSYYLKKIEKYNQKTKARFDSEVIEVFDSVRTVRMLDGEEYETNRYEGQLISNQQESTKNGIKNKLSFAVFFFCILMNYSLGFWYGAKLVSEETINTRTNEPYTVGNVIIVFFTLYMSNLSLSGLPESVTSFNISRVSMRRVLNMIERESRVKNGTEEAPKNIESIKFSNVLFQYDKPLFKDFNLQIREGMTALIGESGSGKTTIISLIMRFYDIFSGVISLNSKGADYNLAKMTSQSLRERIGYVGQEPVLIGKTLKEALNAQEQPDQEIIQILKKVRAWKFVKDIGLDSEYSMLSGGQKQRIAIARALIKKPQILILDEGTSALDRTTQQNVLNAIKDLKIPFVIMIAHRMQTVFHCDNIIKLQSGKIVASGTYPELVKMGIVEELNLEAKQESDEDEIVLEKLESNIKEREEKEKEEVMKQILNEQKVDEEENSEDADVEKEEKQFKMGYICRLMKFNKKYWYLYLIGIVGSIFIGAIFPTFAYLLSNIIVTLSGLRYSTNQAELAGYQEEVRSLSLSLFMISIGSLLIVALRGVSFTHLTESLGFYLKKKAFKTSINKPMADIDDYGPQQYAHIITTNCEDLKYLGGHHLGDMLQNLITVVVGLAIAFAFSWQITLISMAVFPLIILSGKLKMSFDHGMQSNTDKSHKKTHQLVIESVLYIKTVKSLHLKEKILEKYSQSLEEALKMSVKYGNLSGIMFGVGQTLISCLLALIFYFGALLIKAGVVDVLNLYTSIYAIMFAGVQAGGNLYFLSRLSLSKLAACNYFEHIEKEEEELEHSVYIANNRVAQNNEESMKRIKGQIELNDVEFKYANRQTPIFKHFSLRIKRGQKVALVGESGSGKSTITNLIFKIYEPKEGQILFDGININELNISELRRQIGIVSQEPVLFNRSVYENIKYNCKSANFRDVVAASRMAKAYDFVCQGNFGLEQINDEEEDQLDIGFSNSEEKMEKAKHEDDVTIEAFKKKVGTRGSYLSGGQKQRIAIARALVRNPSVIVLDQATSALDNENQKMVQEAIESIHGATQIVIAHRLSTVQNCDKIVVMKKGKIVEEGGYNELLKRNGYFYKLVNAIKDDESQMSEKAIKEE